MPQAKLEYLSIALSKKAGDVVAAIGDNGEVWTAEERLNAINDAVSQIYDDRLIQLGVELFSMTYNEYVRKVVDEIITSAGSYMHAKPTGCRYIWAMITVSNVRPVPETVEVKRIPLGSFYESEFNQYSNYKAAESNPLFRDYEGVYQILGLVDLQYKVSYYFLIEALPVVIDGVNDINYPDSWRPKIIDLAYQLLLNDSQRRA